MRGVLTSITNIVGHARPRSPSISSSDSDVDDDGNDDLRGTGVDPGVLVMRRSYWCEHERCMRFKYVCADWRTCGCAYYVNFGAKG